MKEVNWNTAFEKYESFERKKKKNLNRLQKSGFFNDVEKKKKILDLFSGTGDTLAGLKEEGYRNLFGGDLSLELVRIAKKNNPDIHFIVMDAVFPPFRTKSIDVITIQGGLHHLKSTTEIENVIKDIKRILKEDGYFFCSEPAKTLILKIYLVLIKSPLYRIFNYTRYWKYMYLREKTTYHLWLENFNEIVKSITSGFDTGYRKCGIVTFFFKGRNIDG